MQDFLMIEVNNLKESRERLSTLHDAFKDTFGVRKIGTNYFIVQFIMSIHQLRRNKRANFSLNPFIAI